MDLKLEHMMSDVATQALLPGLEMGTLGSIARRALGSDTADLTGWRVEALGRDMGTATCGVYRVSGSALDRGVEVTWSTILKVTSMSAHGLLTASSDESHPLYWKREALAYGSDLLVNLPGGVRAARCYAVVEMDAGTIWLWLEDVKDTHEAGWPLEQYASAAECLGRFNGAYMAGRPVPDYPWLIRSGSPRGLLAHSNWIGELIADPLTWRHPMSRRLFPVSVRDRLLRLWQERELLMGPLDRVPHTFCHLDAWRKNMFATQGRHRLIMIDWAFPGMAAVGTDAGDLFAASVSLAENGDTAPRLLDQTIFEGYIAGLRDAGWRGEVGAVRFTFVALSAL